MSKKQLESTPNLNKTRRPKIQTKLKIGKKDDKHEKEANLMADKVMMMPKVEEDQKEKLQMKSTSDISIPLMKSDEMEGISVLQREVKEEVDEIADNQLMQKTSEEEKEYDGQVQMKESSSAGAQIASPMVSQKVSNKRGTGQPMSPKVNQEMSSKLGADFSGVKIHNDADAAQLSNDLGAKAFTYGKNVFFNHGMYDPGSSKGKHLLAHELTHTIQQSDQPQIRRKLLIHSKKELKAFKWFFTKNDAKNFDLTKKKPYEVNVKKKIKTIDDQFRFDIIKSIINHSETLRIRGYDPDKEVKEHDIYKNGKLKKSGVKKKLREMGSTVLGAAGVTIPSKTVALGANPNYTGPVTSVANESWIFYAKPQSLAHEFGHIFLMMSGTPGGHGDFIPKSAGIKAPDGSDFEGDVNFFIEEFMEQRFTMPPLIDPKASHFSPTTVNNWPLGKGKTFKGTWLEFKKNNPGATYSKGKKGIEICIPDKGNFCLGDTK
jgi:hypothetical protein